MSDSFCVLHLRASNFVGGPERQVLRYAEFERAGTVTVVVGTFVGSHEGQKFLEAAKQRGFETLALPWDGMGKFRAMGALKRFIKERKVNLVCTHGYRADILGTLAGRLRGVPVASFLRGWTREDLKVRSYEAINRALLPLTTRVVCLSQLQAERLGKRRSLRQKTRIVTNAIEPRAISTEERIAARQELCRRVKFPHDSVFVATAGRLSPEKGAVYFVQAVAAIRKQFPAARFIVFGEGPLRVELEQSTHQLNIDDVVCFAGHIPEFPQLLPGIDIVVNPSLSEEMPNVVLEAMAAGVPVVATNVGGVPEICGADGLVLIPPSDPDSIARSVSVLLGDRAKAQEQGRSGQLRVLEAYSPERQRQQLRTLYKELIPGLGSFPATGAVQDGGRERGHKGSISFAGASNQQPFISVVIPVRNEEAHLGSVLDGLLAQDYPCDRYEILVADGGSTDGTAAVVKQFATTSEPLIRLLPNPKRLSSAGRNVGVRASQGDIVCFIDGHCTIPTYSLLRETVRLFNQTGADCLCRPQPLNRDGNTFLQNVIAHARSTALGHGTDSTIFAMESEGFVDPTSSGAVYLKSVFGRAGFYDESFDACEDVEFNHRVHASGMKSYSSPAIAVYYQPRASLSGLFKQLVRYGRGRFRFISKHPVAFSVSQIIPAAFVAGLLIGGAASFFFAPIRYFYLGTLAVYGITVLLFSSRLGWRFGLGHFFTAPFVYATIHIALGVGFWEEVAATALNFGKWQKSASAPSVAGPTQGSSPDHSEEVRLAGGEVRAKQAER